ncbi:MAG: delta-60 repeat domain-containing protein [Verrucomicrobiales bacterium]|nr:delta-60 repeat domain-containing protein [Verrucomicrobiales bacterium]
MLDRSFDPGGNDIGGLVESVLQQPDGKVLICGNFTSFQGTDRAYVARLNENGTLDLSFSAHPGYWVRHMSLQADGKIVIGGFFKNVTDVPRKCIARLNPDGSLDRSFDPGTGATGTLGVSITGNADPFVFQTALQNDGKILITGNFTKYNETTINGVARLNPDGSLDTTFQVGAGLNSASWGRSIQVLPSHQILLTGWFENYRSSQHNRMVLINPDGSPDDSFRPNFGDRTAIYSALQLPNGQYIVAGHSLNPDGKFHEEIARLNSDGSFDNGFGGSANDKVQSLYVQADGRILLAGEFATVNGVKRTHLARLNPDGTLDEGFQPVLDNFIWTVTPALDGRVLVCGAFTRVDGIACSGVARLQIAPTPIGPPPPPVPQVTAPRIRRGQFLLTVQSVPDRTYTLQYADSLSPTNWTSLSAVFGTGGAIDLRDTPATAAARFYRVKVE